jgi:DNA-binding IclR family transcriptional regulator
VFTKENIKMAEKRKNINIRRTAQILKSFSQDPKSWGVSALASRLGLAKSVVFEILNTLVDEGLIKKNEKEKMYLCGMVLYLVT